MNGPWADPRSSEYHERRLEWWNKNASFWRYYVESTPTHLALFDLVEEGLREIAGDVGSLVDLGCGDGAFLRRLRPMLPSASLVGIDFSAAMVALARSTSSRAEITFETGDFESGPVGDRQVDCVTAILSFTEAGQLDASFRSAAGLLKSGGTCAVVFLDSTIELARHSDEMPPLTEAARLMIDGGFVYSRHFSVEGTPSPAPYCRVIRLSGDYQTAAMRSGLELVAERRAPAASSSELSPLYWLLYFRKRG